MVNEARQILKSVFGYEAFRPLQEEIIGHVLQKKDALVIMPTGGGKSLCYQIPAQIFEGLTIVVSPLISLMKDQVEQLREFGIPAVFLNSTLSPRQYRQNIEMLERQAVKMLYLAPESLLMSRTLDLLGRLNVDCFTIDEAHCISEWGHDFRPEYRQLAEIRKQFPEAVTIALTATATPRVQKDIKNTLELDETEAFIASFNRKNLFLEIREKRDPLGQIIDFLGNYEKQSGIIYCFSRRQVDELYEDLIRNGFSALPYHAGLSEQQRNQNQNAFIRDDVQIIVATIAFGMGINKPDVRFVIHHDLPQNIEAYYQQIGRAGRDGRQADCLLLFSYSDTGKIKYFINQKEGKEKIVAGRHLNALLRFVESMECRRILLMDYFGEVYPSDECGMCDNCIGEPPEVEDLTVPAQKFLSCIVRTEQIFGAAHIANILRGSKAQKIRKHGHTELSTHGIGREFSKKEWKKLARQLEVQGYLSRDPEYGSLKLKQPGVALLKGKERIYGKISEKKDRKEGSYAARTGIDIENLEYNEELYIRLREKRKELADQAEVPPYIIFPDVTLIEMAFYFPQARHSLQQIYGVGRSKLEKYGKTFLGMIQAYCSENNIEEQPRQVATQTGRRSGGIRRHHKVGRAYNNGQSVASLAEEYSVKISTILNHLRNYYREGKKLRADGFLEVSSIDKQQIEMVMDAYEEAGTELLQPIYKELNEEISYEELKILRLYFWASRQ